MDDKHWGFETSADEHPALVVRGLANRHQPMVTMAPGSGSKSVDKPTKVLWVRPDEAIPADALQKVTKFFLHHGRRFDVDKLGRPIAKLTPPKLEALKAMRGLV